MFNHSISPVVGPLCGIQCEASVLLILPRHWQAICGHWVSGTLACRTALQSIDIRRCNSPQSQRRAAEQHPMIWSRLEPSQWRAAQLLSQVKKHCCLARKETKRVTGRALVFSHYTCSQGGPLPRWACRGPCQLPPHKKLEGCGVINARQGTFKSSSFIYHTIKEQHSICLTTKNAQMGLILPRKPPPTTVLYFAVIVTFQGYTPAQTWSTPKPTPEHPFSWPELESGQNEIQSVRFGPQLGKMFEKWANRFQKWAKNLFIT